MYRAKVTFKAYMLPPEERHRALNPANIEIFSRKELFLQYLVPHQWTHAIKSTFNFDQSSLQSSMKQTALNSKSTSCHVKKKNNCIQYRRYNVLLPGDTPKTCFSPLQELVKSSTLKVDLFATKYKKKTETNGKCTPYYRSMLLMKTVWISSSRNFQVGWYSLNNHA